MTTTLGKTTSERTREERLSVSVELRAQGEKGPRRFRMKAYTGVKFSRWWGQMMIDLAGIEGLAKGFKLPMLLDHQAKPVAVADTAEVDPKDGLVLEGYFLDTPDAAHVQKLADQGFPWTASVGIRCLTETEIKEGAELEVNGQTVKGPAFVWSKSKLYETSFITAGPADDATSVEVMSRMPAPEVPAPLSTAADLVAEKTKMRIEILAEHEAKRSAFVTSLTTAGAKRRWARDRFDEGKTIEAAHAEYSALMKAERDEALDRNEHAVRTGKRDPIDGKRVAAGITKGYDPDREEKHAKKRGEVLERLDRDRPKGKKHARLSRREAIVLEELAQAHDAWTEKTDEGLLLRSVFPRHQGGPALLHAYMQAQENSDLRLRASAKGLPIAPPYSFKPELVEELATRLIAGTEHFGGAGAVEKLAGTWGKDAHSYSSMVVKGYLAALFKPLEDDVGAGWAQRVGITIPSNQETETYRFLGNPPQIRKWVGMRQTKFMPQFAQTIANDTYEGTLDFPVNDFRFDKSGQIALRMGELGIRARQHWDILGTQVILNNPVCYDSQTLFVTTAIHTQGGGFNQKNSLTSADLSALSVSNPANPTQQEMAAAIMAVVAYFFTYQDQTGSPLNGDARQFLVIVPPNLWSPAVTAIRAARLNFGQDNPLKEQDYSVDVVPNGWLTTGFVGSSSNTNTFYVARVDSQFRPIVFQDVTGWEAQMLGPGSDATVMRDRIIYGLRAVRGSGPGEWAHIIKATMS